MFLNQFLRFLSRTSSAPSIVALSNVVLAGPLRQVGRRAFCWETVRILEAAYCSKSSRKVMIDSLVVYPVKVGGLASDILYDLIVSVVRCPAKKWGICLKSPANGHQVVM